MILKSCRAAERQLHQLTVNPEPDLDVEDPQVGDEIPARRAVAVVAVEAEAGSVVDGVGWRRNSKYEDVMK